MTDGRYPDVPADADGADALVRLLSEMDESHRTKAVMLVLAAHTEYQHGVADGDIPAGPFAEFTEMCVEQGKAAIDDD